VGKLNQVIAVVAGKKKKAQEALTAAYHAIQKAALFEGISRVYTPKDEEGERLPPESKEVQVKVRELIEMAAVPLTEMMDVVATQDAANTEARAHVVVDGQVILARVPVTHLLFLEKQLTDLATFVGKLPTLDPGERWHHDEASDQYASTPTETTRTKKVPKAFVKYQATKEHPAQVDTYNEDVLVGYWRTVKFSGAIPAQEKNRMLERVRQLQEAVVKAREEANGMEVKEVNVGAAVLGFVFGRGGN
jgi:hypothetical protein